MFLINRKIKDDTGQSTVEAAIMIPIIFILLLLLLQPGILLYDITVMNEAAAEGCRVLASSSEQEKQKLVEPYIRRRLGAIPQQDNFHVHSPGCKYQISLNGNQNSQEVHTVIKNEVKPLPLIGFLASAIGLLNEDNNFVISAEAKQVVRPEWTSNSPAGKEVSNWVGAWLN